MFQHLRSLLLAGLLLTLALAGLLFGEDAGLFAPSNVTTASGKRADPDAFYEPGDCGLCHVRQYEDWKGSLHNRSHHDGIYLAFATRARKEGGDAMYRFCSGCHAPLAVTTGEIPGGEATFLTDDGVSCDACHTAKLVREKHHGGGANASIVIDDGETRYGPLADPAPNQAHESAYSAVHDRAEFCSACHTLTHPHNGLVIENTYQEWKESPYAKAGIQCQDCHMRTVEQALEVARTMKPLDVPGKTFEDGGERPNVHSHLFVGANVNAKLTGASGAHAAAAERRLKSAATIAVTIEEDAIEVAVTNVAAGHAIPTSITELRQVWIDVKVTDAAGKEIFRSGAIDGNGRVDPEAIMYHSVLVDAEGKVTYLPWRAVKMVKEKLIPPKQTVRERYAFAAPAGAKVRAVLRYRSAPQDVMDELFGKGKYPIRTVDMATAEARR